MPTIIDMRILKGQRREAIIVRKGVQCALKQSPISFETRIDDYLFRNKNNIINCEELSIEDQILIALRAGWSLKGEIIPPVGDDVFFFQTVVKYAERDSSQLTL